MKTKRLHLLVLPILAGVLGLFLGGCGPTPEPPQTLPPSQSPVPTPAVTRVPTPLPRFTATTTVAPPPPAQTASPQPTLPPPPPCTDQAAFESDVTVPDDTLMAPGQTFVKTWRLRNSGSCTWSTDYALIFVRGDRMGGPEAAPLPSAVVPGSTVNVSVALTAPAGSGTYEGHWMLRNATGLPFGLGGNADGTFWLRIIVGTAQTPSPTVPAPTATPPVIAGWRGEYYANRDLVGTAALVRDDAAIDFDWQEGAPAAGLPADGFSVRWTRTVSFQAGSYRFYVHCDDGVRVWLDGQSIIDEWHDATGNPYTAERTLTAGSHDLRVEYYENTLMAHIAFWWEPASFPNWRGEYFANADLAGAPALVRDDGALEFDWGSGSPDPVLPADGFSVRWTRRLSFEAGTYRFEATMDDGARIYIDDVLVLNAWSDGPSRQVTATYSLAAGSHDVRVEYYERAGQASLLVTWNRIVFTGWRGEYWSNPNLAGAPARVRDDAVLDFDWGSGAPGPSLPADNFSARWTRTAEFEAKTYRFHVRVDDGAKLWVDDYPVIDGWQAGDSRELIADYALTAGTHALRVEYFAGTGTALIRVWWEEAPVSYADWQGEYWSNMDMTGSPALLRNDAAVDFNWGLEAPAPGLPADQFSVRWSRRVTFASGTYVFSALADNGVRFYLDGYLLINEWYSNGQEIYSVTRTLSGAHTLVIEYYDNSGEALVEFWWQQSGGD